MHKTLGAVCPECLEPFQGKRRRPRRPKVEVHGLDESVRWFFSDTPGHPLGRGMPSGSPLRIEAWHEPSQSWRGESHLMAWERIIRADPCSYCGAPHAGTVDHIEPKTLPVRGGGGAFSWTNLTAACESCNGGKARKPLWHFLWLRAAHRPNPRVRCVSTAKEEDHDQRESVAGRERRKAA